MSSIYISEKNHLILHFFSHTNPAKQIVCEPCSTDDVNCPATHFCKTCDDPEPLCGTCAQHHKKQKQSRNHEICGDIREYQIKEQNERYLITLPISIPDMILTLKNVTYMILKHKYSPRSFNITGYNEL